jgi:hypothetical protein
LAGSWSVPTIIGAVGLLMSTIVRLLPVPSSLLLVLAFLFLLMMYA